MPFYLIGLNHNSAPVEVREQFSQLCVSGLPGADGRNLEAVTVLTCNRVEAYFCGSEEISEKLLNDWVLNSGYSLKDLDPYLYRHRGREAIFHLFKVVSGLDSMVLGENQILHQVKDSYQAAVGANSVGKKLHALFQKALEVGKRVRTETKISENTVSIASTAVELAYGIFGPLNECVVLVIGAGEMGTLVARHMKDRGAKNLLFTNRTFKRAEELAQNVGGKAAPIEDLEKLLSRADVVVSSTGAVRPILTRPMLEKAIEMRQSRPIFAIDIAVPRDIEPECAEIDNVFLYNIDDLQNVVEEHVNLRRVEAQKVLEIVNSETDLFLSMLDSFSVVPLIRGLREKAETIRKLELEKFFPSHRNLDPQLIHEIEHFSNALLAKWLHNPIVSLKKRSSAKREELVEIAQMFGVPEESIPRAPLASVRVNEEPIRDTPQNSAETEKAS